MAIKISDLKATPGKGSESKGQSVESQRALIGVILLLLLIIWVPLAITIWDMGAPIKGLS